MFLLGPELGRRDCDGVHIIHGGTRDGVTERCGTSCRSSMLVSE